MLEYGVFVICVLFVSTLVRSTFGFGDAIIAMPILVMVLGVKLATPLVALAAPVISISILIHHWEKVSFKSIWPLIVSTIVGIPIGLLYLEGVSEKLVKIILAVLIISYTLFKMFSNGKIYLKNDRLAPLFGLLSGILGGAYNTNGPAIVIYGSLRKWQPENFRAILQGVFLPTNILIVAGHGLTGLWTKTVWQYFSMALPLMILAIFLGSKLNKKIPTERFIKYINFFLFLLGITLLLKTIL
jgi:uncharacterized membrane protein YfcA